MSQSGEHATPRQPTSVTSAALKLFMAQTPNFSLGVSSGCSEAAPLLPSASASALWSPAPSACAAALGFALAALGLPLAFGLALAGACVARGGRLRERHGAE